MIQQATLKFTDIVGELSYKKTSRGLGGLRKYKCMQIKSWEGLSRI